MPTSLPDLQIARLGPGRLQPLPQFRCKLRCLPKRPANSDLRFFGRKRFVQLDQQRRPAAASGQKHRARQLRLRLVRHAHAAVPGEEPAALLRGRIFPWHLQKQRRPRRRAVRSIHIAQYRHPAALRGQPPAPRFGWVNRRLLELDRLSGGPIDGSTVGINDPTLPVDRRRSALQRGTIQIRQNSEAEPGLG
ncbi:MAG: hypothetical protein QNJ92_14535 [Alphaproteobacteria bacterium]|nr:hypothetical protein [Alphaproteobacteria bacterium]